MIKEFRDFLLRGNLIELAVAFVMGLAFAALVGSFVDSLILPIVAMIFGKPDFSDLDFTINDAVFRYGAFVTTLITFLTTAAAIFFFVVKPVGAIMARVEKPTEDEITDEERRHGSCWLRSSAHALAALSEDAAVDHQPRRFLDVARRVDLSNVAVVAAHRGHDLAFSPGEGDERLPGDRELTRIEVVDQEDIRIEKLRAALVQGVDELGARHRTDLEARGGHDRLVDRVEQMALADAARP